MTRPRLWVISELYYPEETSTGYFLTRIAEGLADTHDVEAVCSRPTYSERHVAVPWRERHNGVLIHRMRSSRFNKDRTLGRILNLASFTIAAALFCLRRLRAGDRVLIVTNPPTLPPIVGLIARLRRAHAVLLVHDVYPEVLVATGHARPGGAVDRIMGAVTRRTYRLFGDVVVLGRDMAALTGPKLAGSATRLHIIPNWGDPDEIAPLARDANPFRHAHALGDEVVIQFSGNLGRTHDIEAVLDAAQAFGDGEGGDKDRGPVFCFVGYGGKSGLVERRHGTRIRFLPRQPRELLGAMLASADAAVIAYVDRMYGVGVPSRMYNIMAAGVPIIAMAHPQSELAQVVREEACGWVVGAADSVGLVAVARSLMTPEGREDARARGARGREAVLRRYTLPHVLDAFRTLFDRQER